MAFEEKKDLQEITEGDTIKKGKVFKMYLENRKRKYERFNTNKT